MRRALTSFTILSVLIVAGVATAVAAAASQSRTASASLSPNATRAASNVKFSAGPFPTESSLPATMNLRLQNGFSIGSVGTAATMCTAVSEMSDACPQSTEIGTGSLTIKPSQQLFGAGATVPLNLSFYLGAPREAGCAATVELLMTVKRQQRRSVAQLARAERDRRPVLACRRRRAQLPAFPISNNFTGNSKVTIEKLSLDLGSKGGHSLWHNPGSCSRRWGGTLGLGFNGTSLQTPVTFACR